jgi:hypothetical protein
MATALEQILSQVRPQENAASSISGGVQLGFNIAKQRHEMQIQERELAMREEQSKIVFSEKAFAMIPKIKQAKTPSEKKFYLNYMNRLAQNAGIQIPPELSDGLQNSPSMFNSLADMVQSAKDLSKNDPVLFAAIVSDQIRQAGLDPSSADEIFKAATAQNRIEEEKAKLDAQANQRAITETEKALGEIGASSAYRESLKKLPFAQQLPAAAATAAAKKRLDDISQKFLRNENVLKNLPKAEVDALRQLHSAAMVDLQDPAKALAISPVVDLIEQSANNAAGTGAAIVGEQEAKQRTAEAQKKRFDFVKSVSDSLSKRFKDDIETMTMASRALNVLNDPVLANSALGADALVSLISRFVDPKTGVREGEFARVAAAASGSKIEAAKMMVQSIVKGRVFNKEQQEIFRRFLENEVKIINDKVKTARRIAEDDLKGTDIDADHVLLKVFDINPDTMQFSVLSRRPLENAFKRDNDTSFIDWYNGKAKNVAGHSVATARPAPVISDQARSGLQKLRGSNLGSQKVESKTVEEPAVPSAPAQSKKSQSATKAKPDFSKMTEEQLMKWVNTGEL